MLLTQYVESLAGAAAGLTATELDATTGHFALEYPNDLMLRELHILCACNAIASGETTPDQLVASAR